MRLTILFLFLSLPVFSQTVNWREINYFLAEGLECKELLASKVKEIRIIDSTCSVKDSRINNLTEQINNYITIEHNLTAINYELTNTIEQKDAVINKQRKWKRIWAKVVIIEAGVIAAVSLVLLY